MRRRTESPSEWRYSGEVQYSDFTTDSQVQARVVLTITVQGTVATEVVFDTGAQWDVLSPDVALLAGLIDELEPKQSHEEWQSLMIRGQLWRGPLIHGTSVLPSDSGTAVELANTWFVPLDCSTASAYVWPSFLGYLGAMQALRFGIEPRHNRFAFSPLEEG